MALRSLLETLKSTMSVLNGGTFDEKTKSYYLLYNATIYMFDICRMLRKVYKYTIFKERILISCNRVHSLLHSFSGG
jgi:hypothetical protein